MVKKKSPLKIKIEKKPLERREKEKREIQRPREIFFEAKSPKKKVPKYRLFLVAVAAVVFLLFALSFLFSGAKVTLAPKVKNISINENISAVRDGVGDNSGLPFNLVVISGDESKQIEGGEMKDASISAKGTVIIYNAYSSSPQPLLIDTRLLGSNGKTYKTSKKVIVPGMSGGKPGSIEVGIYGSEAGSDYNSDPIDFKIFGFKGTPKYDKFYARSKGGITGGLKGKAPIVSDLDKTSAVNELSAALSLKLEGKLADQIPNGFILYKDAEFLDIADKDATFTPDANNSLTAKVKGTIYGMIFDERKLTQKIASDVIDKYDGSEVEIPNLKNLAFALSDKGSISFADVKNISFTLSGNVSIVWKIDQEKFISDLLSKQKSDFNQILSKYPSIDSAELVMRPFWKSSFPDKASKIEIIVNYPK